MKRPRETVEILVDDLLPVALERRYTLGEVKRILQEVRPDADGRLSFVELQAAILENRRRRLNALITWGRDTDRRNGPRVPYYCKAGRTLFEPVNKPQLNDQEFELARTKMLNTRSALVCGLEDQNDARTVAANCAISRPPLHAPDRWDRYCSLRHTGRSSYVQARNVSLATTRSPHRQEIVVGEAIADRHRGCSSLRAAMLAR